MTEPELHEQAHDRDHLQEREEVWRTILMGESPNLERIRKLVGWMPSNPRCSSASRR